jgi:hypothetical protein
VTVICKVSFLELANLYPLREQEIRTERGPISAATDDIWDGDQQFRSTVRNEVLMVTCSLQRTYCFHLHD